MTVTAWAAKAFVKLALRLPFLAPKPRRELFNFLMSAPESVKRKAASELLDWEHFK